MEQEFKQIIEVEVNTEEALNNVSRLTDVIKSNKENTKQLKEEQAQLEKEGKRNSEAYKENTKIIALNKLCIFFVSFRITFTLFFKLSLLFF